jgi:hypothetical protein
MNLDTEFSEPRPAIPTVRRNTAKRVVAGLAGAAALVLAASFTFGGALVAAAGVAVGSAISRGRGRRLSRGVSWVAAVVAVEVALIGFLGFAALRAPSHTFSDIKHAMDSSQANPSPPPAWLERIAPGTAARSRAERSAMSGPVGGAFGVWAIVVGSVFFSGMLSALVGTLGWLATLPLAYGVTGRWIGSPAEQT